MRNDNNIITLGDDWRSAPRKWWGSEDRARDAELKSQLKQMGEPTVPQPLHPVPSVPLYGDPVGDERRRRRDTDRKLEKHGLAPRHWV
jgi:hypothetical protein